MTESIVQLVVKDRNVYGVVMLLRIRDWFIQSQEWPSTSTTYRYLSEAAFIYLVINKSCYKNVKAVMFHRWTCKFLFAHAWSTINNALLRSKETKNRDLRVNTVHLAKTQRHRLLPSIWRGEQINLPWRSKLNQTEVIDRNSCTSVCFIVIQTLTPHSTVAGAKGWLYKSELREQATETRSLGAVSCRDKPPGTSLILVICYIVLMLLRSRY
jgi:hypothetical protein